MATITGEKYVKKDFDFDKYGAFFAFNEEQLLKGANGKPLEDIVSVGGIGLYCPKDTLESMMIAYKDHNKKENERRIQEMGLKAIILYELNNYECWYQWDYEDALPICKEYGATEEQVATLFRNRNAVI